MSHTICCLFPYNICCLFFLYLCSICFLLLYFLAPSVSYIRTQSVVSLYSHHLSKYFIAFHYLYTNCCLFSCTRMPICHLSVFTIPTSFAVSLLSLYSLYLHRLLLSLSSQYPRTICLLYSHTVCYLFLLYTHTICLSNLAFHHLYTNCCLFSCISICIISLSHNPHIFRCLCHPPVFMYPRPFIHISAQFSYFPLQSISISATLPVLCGVKNSFVPGGDCAPSPGIHAMIPFLF